MGEYYFVLEPANDWLRNKTHLVENDSTIVIFSIINYNKNSDNMGKPSSLSDMLIGRADLPNGDWKVQRKNSESSDMPLSVLVEEGGVSFICKNQDERKNFAQGNILFNFSQIEWKTQDLPPQHLMEWILFADRPQDSETIFEVMKKSLQSCESVTLVDENDGNKIHHSFVPISFPEYGNKTYAIKEDINPVAGQQYLVVIYGGTSYSVLVQKGDKVIFTYYMTGHSPLGHDHFEQINSIVESVIDKLGSTNEQ